MKDAVYNTTAHESLIYDRDPARKKPRAEFDTLIAMTTRS